MYRTGQTLMDFTSAFPFEEATDSGLVWKIEDRWLTCYNCCHHLDLICSNDLVWVMSGPLLVQNHALSWNATSLLDICSLSAWADKTSLKLFPNLQGKDRFSMLVVVTLICFLKCKHGTKAPSGNHKGQ